MNKVVKVILVSVALVSVFALCSFNVFAEDVSLYFNSVSGGIYESGTTLIEKTWQLGPSSVRPGYDSVLLCNYTDSTATERYGGFYIVLKSQGFVKVESGYYFNYSLILDGATTNTLPALDNPVKAYASCSDGSIYSLRTTYTYDSSVSRFIIRIGGYVGDGSALSFGTLIIDAPGVYSHGKGLGAYQIFASNTIQVLPTPDQVRHEELIEEIQQVGDDILNDWNTDSDIAGDMNEIAGELEEAEDGVFGGMTDEEARAKIDDALDIGSLPNPDGTGSIAVMRFLNRTIDVLGTGVLSVLTMSMAIGLALTILGRSY